jgi:hypothetical protein
MGALFLFVGLFLFIKKDVFKLFVLHLFMSLAIPYNDYIYHILGMELVGIRINYILMLLILVLIFKQLYAKRFNIIKVSKIDIFMVFFFMVICLYFFVGYYNKNTYLWFDMKVFVFFFLNYIIFRSVVNNDNYIKVINVIFISSLFYSFIVIYIYLFMKDYLPFIYGDKLFSWWGKRITFSNVSMCLITIPLSIYCLLQNNYSNIKKFYFFLVFSLNLIAMLLSQTRAVIMMSTFNSIIVLVTSYYNIFNLKKINIKKAYRITIFVVFISISLNIFYFLDTIFGTEVLNNVINRFSEGQETLNVRDVSNEMAKEEIIRNIWGYGLGKEAILYNTNYSINNVGPFIDNILFTLGLKIGLLGVFMFLILLLVPLVRLFFYKNNDKILVIVIYISFILMTAILNAQIVYSVPIVLTFILFICISKINREKVIKIKGEEY